LARWAARIGGDDGAERLRGGAVEAADVYVRAMRDAAREQRKGE
jgi:hypothetical protein